MRGCRCSRLKLTMGATRQKRAMIVANNCSGRRQRRCPRHVAVCFNFVNILLYFLLLLLLLLLYFTCNWHKWQRQQTRQKEQQQSACAAVQQIQSLQVATRLTFSSKRRRSRGLVAATATATSTAALRSTGSQVRFALGCLPTNALVVIVIIVVVCNASSASFFLLLVLLRASLGGELLRRQRAQVRIKNGAQITQDFFYFLFSSFCITHIDNKFFSLITWQQIPNNKKNNEGVCSINNNKSCFSNNNKLKLLSTRARPQRTTSQLQLLMSCSVNLQQCNRVLLSLLKNNMMARCSFVAVLNTYCTVLST